MKCFCWGPYLHTQLFDVSKREEKSPTKAWLPRAPWAEIGIILGHTKNQLDCRICHCPLSENNYPQKLSWELQQQVVTLMQSISGLLRSLIVEHINFFSYKFLLSFSFLLKNLVRIIWNKLNWKKWSLQVSYMQLKKSWEKKHLIILALTGLRSLGFCSKLFARIKA